ncbi:uncharacterized protein FOMMEDRAFT_160244 [Fomitiporia mediterranea MF3/22]|uniref:uncharacterized protein n=1 Tax=Fomitiporia mediterranea (strain MF3/22) TaxID=694068 RepID=UPI0004408BFF|nr:uncharacterized protein FOMMEDRAFT_160244 [Fomitiporia mediterranea MF3/22]EJC99802.1 hypothetical protein FOMMEDRAFT_160244 [Fomitiporia mediterranea MF3/22]
MKDAITRLDKWTTRLTQLLTSPILKSRLKTTDSGDNHRNMQNPKLRSLPSMLQSDYAGCFVDLRDVTTRHDLSESRRNAIIYCTSIGFLPSTSDNVSTTLELRHPSMPCLDDRASD